LGFRLLSDRLGRIRGFNGAGVAVPFLVWVKSKCRPGLTRARSIFLLIAACEAKPDFARFLSASHSFFGNPTTKENLVFIAIDLDSNINGFFPVGAGFIPFCENQQFEFLLNIHTAG
jgi:hypothetical protein